MHTTARIAACAACGMLVAAMAACGGAPKQLGPAEGKYGNCAVSGKRGEFRLQPEAAGALTVETSLPAPGWWNGDAPTTVKDGYEYCMAANIAHRAGLNQVIVKDVPFDALVGGKTKGFDLALLELTITDKRKEVVDFSPPYFSADQGVMTKKGTKIDSESIRDARIGVSRGKSGAEFVMDQLKPSKPVMTFPSNQDTVAALADGRVDAVVADTTILLAQAKPTGGALHVVGQYKTGEHYGALYPKGSPNKETLDRIIRQMISDGTLAKLSAIYLGKAYGTDPANVPYFTLRRTVKE
ncbi:ABC transporter substrate-binding protein [Streptomyces vinaceus]